MECHQPSGLHDIDVASCHQAFTCLVAQRWRKELEYHIPAWNGRLKTLGCHKQQPSIIALKKNTGKQMTYHDMNRTTALSQVSFHMSSVQDQQDLVTSLQPSSLGSNPRGTSLVLLRRENRSSSG